MKPKRIGLFSGTFDPFHVGHAEACLVALGVLELDEVLVMIEKNPGRKQNVTPYEHRKKMVQLSLQDFKHINFFDHPESNITFTNTLPDLQAAFPNSQACVIIGSDMLAHLGDWPEAATWLPELELCVVLRNNTDESHAKKILQKIDVKRAKLLPAVWSPISSSTIKAEIAKSGHSDGVNPDVIDYIKANHLYES